MNTTDSVGIITNSTSKNNMLSFSPVNQNHSPEVKYSEKKQEQVVHLTEAYSHLNNTNPFQVMQPTYCKDDSSDDDEFTLTESETKPETRFFGTRFYSWTST